MIKTKSKGLLIVVSGPSGAGKGTINGELLKRNSNLWMSTSMTTRAPRGNEQNGKEYFFVTKEEFDIIISEFIERKGKINKIDFNRVFRVSENKIIVYKRNKIIYTKTAIKV